MTHGGWEMEEGEWLCWSVSGRLELDHEDAFERGYLGF